jgi:hypothetical protein
MIVVNYHVLTQVNIKIMVFPNVTLCNFVDRYQCLLHLLPGKWRQ